MEDNLLDVQSVMDTQSIIRQIQGGSPTNEIIRDLIDYHATKAVWMKTLYKEYKGNVPVKHRDYEYNNKTKIDRKLSNDYRGYIVDTLTGYVFGTPVSYSIDKDQYLNEKDYDDVTNLLKMFIRRNSIADIDAETAKKASICGYGARLMYIDKEGRVRIMNADPWECIFIEDSSLDEPEFALRYYQMEYVNGKTTEYRTHVEWYDSKYVEEFEQEQGIFFAVPGSKREHMFDGVPLIEFPNNEERMGDFEKVRDLIDAYDFMLSDVQSELEEQRLAYLVFAGASIDPITMHQARLTGAFSLPDSSDTVSYLVKNLSDTVIENQKKTLRENIHKFSKTVDMSDETFSGATQSGESRKWKLLAMENLAVTKERKFSRSFRLQFAMVEKVWQDKMHRIIDDTIMWKLIRNLPVELTQEATILTTLNGVISNKTRLGLASFIDDADAEMALMKEDAEAYSTPYGTLDTEDEEEPVVEGDGEADPPEVEDK